LDFTPDIQKDQISLNDKKLLHIDIRESPVTNPEVCCFFENLAYKILNGADFGNRGSPGGKVRMKMAPAQSLFPDRGSHFADCG
jgi:hypothetical protein